MAKLIFETDDGKQSEILLSSIKTESLKEDDVILLECEVGLSASPKDVNEHMVHIRNFIQAYFPKNKIIVFSMRDGIKDIELKIVNKE